MSGTVVVRKFASTPVRSAMDTWQSIANLLADAGSVAHQELMTVAGIMSSLIADETPRDNSIVVAGVGSRLRIYCVFGEDAIIGGDVSEGALGWCPTDGDWSMSVPCLPVDLEWVRTALATTTLRITARDVSDSTPIDTEPTDQKVAGEFGPVDVEAFLRS